MANRQEGRLTPPPAMAVAQAHGLPADECWACGDECKPQRSHVVPFAVKREHNNEPTDFVLLCAGCHRQAPDVADSAYMWTWIEEMQAHHINTMATAFRVAFTRLPVSRERMLEVFEAVSNKTTTHEGRWSLATKVWIIHEMARILREERSAKRAGKPNLKGRRPRAAPPTVDTMPCVT